MAKQMKKNTNPSPGFTRQGKCSVRLLNIAKCRALVRPLLRWTIGQPLKNAQKEPLSVAYLVNPTDGHFTQVCVTDPRSIVHFRFELRGQQKDRVTLSYTGTLGELAAFAARHELLLF